MSNGPEQTIADLGEFGVIARIQRLVGGVAPSLVRGIGDDAAVFRPASDRDLVITCDVQIAGRHFRPEWTTPRAIGRRTMMVNLSDLAAMGAEPLLAFLSLGLPPTMPVPFLDELYAGFLDALGESATIAGGNLSSVEREWFLDATLVGSTPRGKALGRDGARIGDKVFVTGWPGRSAAGLSILRHLESAGVCSAEDVARWIQGEAWAQPLLDAYLAPIARLDVGVLLREMDGTGAVIDVSDGLAGDLGHLCRASRVGAELRSEALHRDPLLDRLAERRDLGGQSGFTALAASDDYELLFTARPESADRIAETISLQSGVRITEIGVVIPLESGLTLLEGAAWRPLDSTGWDHFAR